jgi:galactokinase
VNAATFFEHTFGRPPAVVATAPGRVNLLGEHTDYNEGFVLPATLPLRTAVAVGPSDDGRYHLASHDLSPGQGTVEIAPNAIVPPGFARYVIGCFEVLRDAGYSAEPCAVAIESSVPIGAGLSSSAALEVGVIRALRQWHGFQLDDVRIARLAQRAEIEHAGVNCGIMDQMAVSVGEPDSLLFLDTRSLSSRQIPFPEGSEIAVFDSGVPRTLAASAYNQRREECTAAAAALGVASLRDVHDLRVIDELPEPLRRRARHVFTENRRVIEAASGVSAPAFGRLMSESHRSLRDDYEVSIEALDVLVECLQQHASVYGCKLTGAGFGGACVALLAAGSAADVKPAVLEEFRGRGFNGALLF